MAITVDQIHRLDVPPSKWRHLVMRLYTWLLLRVKEDEVRNKLLTDPSLFNARYWAVRGKEVQYMVMAIHFNTMIDRRAWLTPAEARALVDGHLPPPDAYQLGENCVAIQC
jgi:hypothetical protein